MSIPRRRGRVPVRLQLTSSECGAACLSMILGYFGCKLSVASCRAVLPGGRDGTSARALADAARSFGMSVKAIAVSAEGMANVGLPAIAHWRSRHFIILEKFASGDVVIVDPAVGRRTLQHAEFWEDFSGVVLTIEPSAAFRRRGIPAGQRWRHFTPYLSSYKISLAKLLVASVLLQAAALAVPLTTAVIVDRVIGLSQPQLLPIIALAAGMFLATYFAVNLARDRLLARVQVRLDENFMQRFCSHLLSLPLAFFDSRGQGDLLARLSSNTAIRETLSAKLIAAILDSIFLVFYAVLLAFIDRAFAITVLILVVMQAVVYFAVTRRVHTMVQSELVARSEAQNYLVEVLAGVATLKASGAERRAYARWTKLFKNELSQTRRLNLLQATISTVQTVTTAVCSLSLLLLGAWRVTSGMMSLGMMLAAIALAAALLAPVASLVANGLRLQRMGATLDRLADVLDASPEQTIQGASRRTQLSGAIELRNVSFSYAPHSPPVLRDVCLTIRPGEKVVIAGRTGSGKSTLARILLGLYPPTDGTVLYDGFRLESFDLAHLRAQFGVVLQEAALFSGTIRENILPESTQLGAAEIVAAATSALIHTDITAMPMGYDTDVGEGGAALSGGQRQRVALARALMHEPVVLVLDEATSHLDSLTESLIDDNLSSLNCTRIVVAHRLSTIRNADRIVVLDDGAIVEEGSHDELVVKAGYYRALTEGQTVRQHDADNPSQGLDKVAVQLAG